MEIGQSLGLFGPYLNLSNKNSAFSNLSTCTPVRTAANSGIHWEQSGVVFRAADLQLSLYFRHKLSGVHGCMYLCREWSHASVICHVWTYKWAGVPCGHHESMGLSWVHVTTGLAYTESVYVVMADSGAPTTADFGMVINGVDLYGQGYLLQVEQVSGTLIVSPGRLWQQTPRGHPTSSALTATQGRAQEEVSALQVFSLSRLGSWVRMFIRWIFCDCGDGLVRAPGAELHSERVKRRNLLWHRDHGNNKRMCSQNQWVQYP